MTFGRDDKVLGALIARDIFKTLDDPNDKCQRLEAKGGQWPDRETKMGGLDESALAIVIAESLGQHRTY